MKPMDINIKEKFIRSRLVIISITTDKPFVSRPFYRLGIDPHTNTIYGALSPSFSQSGYVYRYKPTGQLVDSVKVEIGPTGFFFK